MNIISKLSLMVLFIALGGNVDAMRRHARMMQAEEAAPGEVCPVCMGLIQPDDVVESGADYCGCDPMHVAHQRCMANWMAEQGSCPACERYRQDLIDLPVNVTNALLVLNRDAYALGCVRNFFSPMMSRAEFGQGIMHMRSMLLEDERDEFELAAQILNLWIINNPDRYVRAPHAFACTPLPGGHRRVPGVQRGGHIKALLMPDATEFLSDVR